MAKRINWQENDVLNIKISDNLFTVAQMLKEPYLMFFQISNMDGQWKELHLSEIPNLFCIPVAREFLTKRVENKVKSDNVADSSIQIPKFWIIPHLNFDGGFLYKGGKLIELDPKVGETNSLVLKNNLLIDIDKEIIEKCELTNLWGDEDLINRLVVYFTKGINEDPLKKKVFR